MSHQSDWVHCMSTILTIIALELFDTKFPCFVKKIGFGVMFFLKMTPSTATASSTSVAVSTLGLALPLLYLALS